ncbi:MAG: hypothetical protein ACRELD_02905 [Longimicrobiales bacterium]
MAKHENPTFARARDELFSHIHRCGVLESTDEQKLEWMQETMEFMAERYPALAAAELTQLREIGLRFCRPVIPHGPQPDPEPAEEDATAA